MQLYSRSRKIGIVFLLALSLFALSVTSVYAAGSERKKSNADDLEKQRQETLDEIKDLKNNIGTVQKDIDRLTTEKKTIQQYITDLDKQIGELTKQIEDFEGKIVEKEEDIEQTKKELEEAKIACDEQYAWMKKRIQFIYENPTESLFEALCSAGSVAEFLNRADNVSALYDSDRQMMEKLMEIREEIAQQEKTLEAELEELQMMRDEISAQKKKANSKINRKKGELNDKMVALDNASDEKSDYKKELKEQEKLLNQIEDQIAAAANGDAYEGSTTGFIWPCPSYTRISSKFGPRPQPTPGASTNHRGVDLAAPYGSSILASAAGVVTTARYSASAGNYVVISHGNGMSTVYMHASSLHVSVGEVVKQGQVIAKVGSTGYSTGNHLHFGVIKNGSYVNPLGYVSP